MKCGAPFRDQRLPSVKGGNTLRPLGNDSRLNSPAPDPRIISRPVSPLVLPSNSNDSSYLDENKPIHPLAKERGRQGFTSQSQHSQSDHIHTDAAAASSFGTTTRTSNKRRPTELNLTPQITDPAAIDATSGVASVSPLFEPSPIVLSVRGRSPSPYRSGYTTDEQLEKHIESILTTLPVHVNFEKDAPLDVSGMVPQARWQVPSSSDFTRGSAQAPESKAFFTLRPAFQKETRNTRLSTNSDVRLFYLNQAEREGSTKLFLRLAGAGGHQVILRVKGGWCDFGEV